MHDKFRVLNRNPFEKLLVPVVDHSQLIFFFGTNDHLGTRSKLKERGIIFKNGFRVDVCAFFECNPARGSTWLSDVPNVFRSLTANKDADGNQCKQERKMYGVYRFYRPQSSHSLHSSLLTMIALVIHVASDRL